jgi:hemolysin activation/secretion protein
MVFSAIAAAVLAQQTTTSPYIQPRVEQRAPRVTPQAAQGSTSIQAQGTAEPIRGIVFEGVQAPAAVAAAAQGFIGRPATRETLVELATALSRAYQRTDIALYTVSVPEQDFSEGVVTVNLVEGWVSAVEVKAADSRSHSLLRRHAARLVGGKPLSRGLYERQSALIQAIPGLRLERTFENPEDDDSVAWVLTPRQRRVEVATGINNRGPALVGDLVLNAGIDFYKLLADGDQLSFTGAATPNFRNYRAVEAAYGLPIGSDGLRLTGTAASVWTRARDFDIKGRAKLAALNLTYPLLRRATRAADVSFSVDGVNSRNAIFGNIIATERSRAARLSGAFVLATDKQTLSTNAILSRGLKIFDAQATEPNEIVFSKLSGAVTYERVLVGRVLGRANITGQFSRDRLPAAELFTVGGPSIGRAFDTGILTGDRGIGGYAELAVRPIKAANFAQSEAYLFGDAARLTVERRAIIARQEFDLASAGAGLRARYKDRIQLGVEAARVLNRPFAGYNDKWRLSAFYSIVF